MPVSEIRAGRTYSGQSGPPRYVLRVDDDVSYVEQETLVMGCCSLAEFAAWAKEVVRDAE